MSSINQSNHHILQGGKLFHENILKLLHQIVTRLLNSRVPHINGRPQIEILHNLNMLLEHPHYNVPFWQALDPVYFKVLDVEGDLSHEVLLVLFAHQ